MDRLGLDIRSWSASNLMLNLLLWLVQTFNANVAESNADQLYAPAIEEAEGISKPAKSIKGAIKSGT